MSEEIKDTNDTNVDDPKVDDDVDSQSGKLDKTKVDKTFTQAELDRVVRDRVKREKDTNSKMVSEWETEKTELTTHVESLEKVVNELLVSQKMGLDETVIKLLDKLPVLDQVVFLAENLKTDKKQSSVIPGNPKPQSKNNGTTKVKKYF
jgi:hypothetical protein